MSYPSNSVTETLISQILALGGPTPTSFGLGELLRDLDNAIAAANSFVVSNLEPSNVAPAGQTVILIDGGGTTATLTPHPPHGTKNTFLNYSSNTWTIAPGAGDIITNYNAFGSLTLPAGSMVVLQYMLTSSIAGFAKKWYVQFLGSGG